MDTNISEVIISSFQNTIEFNYTLHIKGLLCITIDDGQSKEYHINEQLTKQKIFNNMCHGNFKSESEKKMLLDSKVNWDTDESLVKENTLQHNQTKDLLINVCVKSTEVLNKKKDISNEESDSSSSIIKQDKRQNQTRTVSSITTRNRKS